MNAALSREEIEAIKRDEPAIQNQPIKKARAFLISPRHGVLRQNICSVGLASNAGITRAEVVQMRISSRKAVCTRSHREVKCIHPNRILSSTLVMCILEEGKALDTTLVRIKQENHIMMIDYYLPEMISRRTVLMEAKTPIVLFLDGHSSCYTFRIPTQYQTDKRNSRIGG